MFGLLTCSSSQSMGQLSYTCFAMSEAESFGEKRNSFVFPLTKMRRKLIISAGTWLDILPFESGPEVYAENKTKTRAEVLELWKNQKKKKKLSQFWSFRSELSQKKRKKVEVTWEHKSFWGERREGSRSSAAVAAPGPAAPGGQSRVTHGHGAGWEGVKCAVLFPRPRRWFTRARDSGPH